MVRFPNGDAISIPIARAESLRTLSRIENPMDAQAMQEENKTAQHVAADALRELLMLKRDLNSLRSYLDERDPCSDITAAICDALEYRLQNAQEHCRAVQALPCEERKG